MDAILWQDKSLSLLDQRRWPGEEVWLDCPDWQTVTQLLATDAVQGEGIVAAAGAYAYALAAMALEGQEAFHAQLAQVRQAILAARPQCAALAQGLDTVDTLYQQFRDDPQQVVTAIVAGAVTVHRQEVIASRAMSREGVEILPDEAAVLLCCREGAFHAGVPGGPVGVIRAAFGKGRVSRVYLCAGSPRQENTRRLAHCLLAANIPTTIMPDSAAAVVMARGQSDVIFVEALEVAANGDILAPAGAYELAIAAYFHSIQVYAVSYARSIDLQKADAAAFPLEDADGQAILAAEGLPPQEGLAGWAAAAETIPGYLLTGIITDKGICFAPYEETIPEKLSSTRDKAFLVL